MELTEQPQPTFQHPPVLHVRNVAQEEARDQPTVFTTKTKIKIRIKPKGTDT